MGSGARGDSGDFGYSGDQDDPAERLLVEAPVEPGARLLVIEGGAGTLLQRHAPGCREILFHNSDVRKHAAALGRMGSGISGEARCLLGDIPRASVPGRGASVWPDALDFPAGRFEAVLYRLGKGTAALHGAIREAWELLGEGGSLFLAGHTREGVKSVAKRAEGHFGNAELLELKSSCRLLRFRKSGPAPRDPIPDPGYFDPVPLVLDLPGGIRVPYLAKPGIFSYRATDAGTALLARCLHGLGGLEGLRVLDLGCGSGVLSLAACRLGVSEAVATDSNAIAVAVAKRNFADSGCAGRAVCTNLAEGVGGGFDLVLSNPPFHQGSETDYSFPARILDAVLPCLKPGGRLLLVANQFLDYPAQAAGRFTSCDLLIQESGFRVFRMT